MFLAMIVIGGMGSVRGALLGAAFYVIVPEAFRGFKDAPALIFVISIGQFPLELAAARLMLLTLGAICLTWDRD